MPLHFTRGKQSERMGLPSPKLQQGLWPYTSYIALTFNPPSFRTVPQATRCQPPTECPSMLAGYNPTDCTTVYKRAPLTKSKWSKIPKGLTAELSKWIKQSTPRIPSVLLSLPASVRIALHGTYLPAAALESLLGLCLTVWFNGCLPSNQLHAGLFSNTALILSSAATAMFTCTCKSGSTP